MLNFNGPLPLFSELDQSYQRPGPPSRLDIHQRKLEHDKMYLQSFEIEQLSRIPRNDRKSQQFAELSLQGNRKSTGLNRIRLQVSNLLISIANGIRPDDSNHRDIISAR